MANLEESHTEFSFADHYARWAKTYGMGNFGALQNTDKFDSASEKVQLRFMRLWVRARKQLAKRTLKELHVDMAPINGSIDHLQMGLHEQMGRWLDVWVQLSKVTPQGWKKKANIPIFEEITAYREWRDNQFKKQCDGAHFVRVSPDRRRTG